MNNHDDEDYHHDTVFIDSNVQEKNVAYPTDVKLHKKIVKKVLGIVKKIGLPLRQSYIFVLKGIYRDQRFWNHPKNRKRPSGQKVLTYNSRKSCQGAGA